MEVGVGSSPQTGRVGVEVPLRVPMDEDASLVAALADGDAAALERIYERHSRAVYSLALHVLGQAPLAEEVVQETFLKLWRQPAAYQPSRGKLSSWLLGVAHHHAIDLLRRRKLELRHRADPPASSDADPAANPLEALPSPSDDANPEVRAGRSEQQHAVTGALALLPAEQRVPLELAYYRGLTQVEIATLLHQPLGTIKTRMRLALRRLRGMPALSRLYDEA